MTKIDNIPVYDAILGEDGGMLRISLVDLPAVMSDFVAFKNQEQPLRFRIEDEEQRRVLGVVMRADFPIYRRDEDGTEYYLIYRADTIKAMAEKYLVEGRQNLVNTMHKKGSDVEDVNMTQWFIKDTANGVSPEGFSEIADGSLFAEYHVENDEVWEKIKDGTYKGFSLEGYFHFVPENDTQDVQRIVDDLDGKFKEQPKRKHKMSKVKRILQALAAVLLGAVTTDKGVLAWDGDEDLKAGDRVWIEDEDGNRSDPEDGDYRTDDRKVIRVADGVVTEIVDDEAEVSEEGSAEEQLSSVDTDNGRLEWDGDGDLEAGVAVYVYDAEGNRVAAPDGDYRTEDGKVIRVADGRVSEIVDDRAEVEEGRAAFNAQRVQMEASYDEIYGNIRAAIEQRRGNNNFYIDEAGSDFAVIAVYDEDTFNVRHYRYGLSTAEDGTVTLDEGDAVEVKMMFVPVDFVSPFDSNRDEEMEKLRAEVERLRKKPAAEPCHTAFSQSMGKVKTGNKGLDRIAELMSR